MTLLKLKLETIQVAEDRRTLGDLTSLKQSISTVGLLNPITVTPDYQLVAGYHRLEACRQLGWSEIPAYVIVPQAEQIAAYKPLLLELAAIDENLIRNNGTEAEQCVWLSRRKAIYEQLYPEIKHGGAPGAGRGKGKKSASCKEEIISSFQKDTADKTNQTERIVRYKAHIGAAIADVLDTIQSTPVADSQKDLLQLANIRKKDEQLFDEVLTVLQSGNAGTVAAATQAIKSQAREQQLAEAIQSISHTPPTPIGQYQANGIYVCDIANLELPAESVDLFFTDPPWDESALKTIEHLGRVAKQALRPGGWCLFYIGKMFLPDAINTMGNWLEYRTMLSIFQPDNNTKIQKLHLFEAWRPILVYQRPPISPALYWAPDALQGRRDKSWHEWQQGLEPIVKWIAAFSEPNQLLVDPMVGSGTMLQAARDSGRRYLGFDCDERTVALALLRLKSGHTDL